MRRARFLLILVLLLPVLEVASLVLMGKWIGSGPTFLLLLVSALVGALLVKKESRKAWQAARQQWASGQMPGQALLDGLCLFVGGILLIIPGLLSDLAGLFLILPFTRPLAKLWLLNVLRRWLTRGNARIYYRR